METRVGLDELYHSASDLVRRVEVGEKITVTVAGQARARLVPVRPGRWRTWSALEGLFDGPVDEEWETDRELVDGTAGDPRSDA